MERNGGTLILVIFHTPDTLLFIAYLLNSRTYHCLKTYCLKDQLTKPPSISSSSSSWRCLGSVVNPLVTRTRSKCFAIHLKKKKNKNKNVQFLTLTAESTLVSDLIYEKKNLTPLPELTMCAHALIVWNSAPACSDYLVLTELTWLRRGSTPFYGNRSHFS